LGVIPTVASVCHTKKLETGHHKFQRPTDGHLLKRQSPKSGT